MAKVITLHVKRPQRHQVRGDIPRAVYIALTFELLEGALKRLFLISTVQRVWQFEQSQAGRRLQPISIEEIDRILKTENPSKAAASLTRWAYGLTDRIEVRRARVDAAAWWLLSEVHARGITAAVKSE